MKKFISLFTALVCFFSMSLSAADSTFVDYQNYNHGYCPECNSYPCGCETFEGTCPAPTPCNTPPPPAASPCDPCDPNVPYDPNDPYDPNGPPAAIYGADSGISVVAIGIGIAAVVAAAVIIIASSNGASSFH